MSDAAGLDGPWQPPAGVTAFDWALHVSEALSYAAQLVLDWQQMMDTARLPTLEELQWPPFNLTVEFAYRFLKWAQMPEIAERAEGAGE